jgi:peptidylprolyl isomerase
MKKTALLLTAALLACASHAAPAKATKAAKAVKAPKAVKSAADVLKDSPAADWRGLDPENTLLMDLGSGQVIIELAPRFAPAHAANIRSLARGGYWDGLAILRVQDNFVTQWGDPDGDERAKARPLPADVKTALPAEFSVPIARIGKGSGFTRLPDVDGWAPRTGFVDGMPVAADPKAGKAWLAHCYGMVGAGRGNEVDSSIGTELYTVIGHAPRGLDLNITVVGRVLKGMELLSALPRGAAAMGFYDKPDERTAIQRVRLLAEMSPDERPALQVLKTDSKTWQQLLDARRYRSGWYVHSPAHVDICSAGVPTRPAPTDPAS